MSDGQCGITIPNPLPDNYVLPRANIVFITFTSDGSLAYSGFDIQYRQERKFYIVYIAKWRNRSSVLESSPSNLTPLDCNLNRVVYQVYTNTYNAVAGADPENIEPGGASV